MPTANDLPEVLETTEPERLATGFIFTEGPLWHPDGYWYFVDLRRNQLLRLTPGKEPELVRTTIGGNGTTFDLQGRLIVCEGDDRRLTRMGPDGKVESLIDNYRGGRFKPAERRDLSLERVSVLHRSGQAPSLPRARDTGSGRGGQPLGRRPRLSAGAGRRFERAGELRIPERAGAVAGRAHDVRREHALLAIHPRDPARHDRQHGRARHLRRPQTRAASRASPTASRSTASAGCIAPGRAASGSWRRTAGASESSGGPEQAVNFAFGGPDLRTLFCCAHTSVYTLRVKVPGNPHPWYKRRGQ